MISFSSSWFEEAVLLNGNAKTARPKGLPGAKMENTQSTRQRACSQLDEIPSVTRPWRCLTQIQPKVLSGEPQTH